MPIPPLRLRTLNDAPILPDRDYVLYWMVAFRRMRFNYALDHAIERAYELDLPLLIFEPLRAGYAWASDRHHRFVIDGMCDNRRECEGKRVTYFPYLEAKHGDGAGLLEALVKRAACLISDDYPAFFIPAMHSAAAKRLDLRFEVVDSNGMLPLRATDRVFSTAYSFRGFLQKNLKPFVAEAPKPEPLSKLKLKTLSGPPKSVTERWPIADLDSVDLGEFQIDHSVSAVDAAVGGSVAAGRLLNSFLGGILPKYNEDRNEPERRGTSQLSGHLHFGHISIHEIFAELSSRESGWSVDALPDKGRGSREGWWKMSGPTEGFLDELITWREIGYNMASKIGRDYEGYASLPDWAQATLDLHRNDPRDYVYDLEQFEKGQTHDPLWNAAQTQLVREGRIHNYLRMLWGKKILEWTKSPEDARHVMVELNNKYALDGRDPNSYSGIMWVLGRYDRAWGPERPIYGKIRYMSSDNTARKIKVKNYIARYGTR